MQIIVRSSGCFDGLRSHPEKRLLMVPTLTALLTAHSRAEEAEVYPVAREEADEAEEAAHWSSTLPSCYRPVDESRNSRCSPVGEPYRIRASSIARSISRALSTSVTWPWIT